MQIIGTNTIKGVIATDERDSYEAAALLTDELSDRWMAHGNSATIVAGVAGGSAIALFGTNAVTVTVKKYDHLAMSWADGTVWGSINSAAWATYTGTVISMTGNRDAYGLYHLWGTYSADSDDHVIEIELTAPSGEAVYAGAVYGGVHESIEDLWFGSAMGVNSLSTVYPMGQRSEWVDFRDGDVPRTWEGQSGMTAVDFFTLRDLARQRGRRPLAWRLSENLTDGEWIALAKFTQLPRGAYSSPGRMQVTYSLQEAT